MSLEEKIGELLKAKKMTLSTAESCTGGSIAALITSVPGSSEYFKGGVVAYSNEVKMNMLYVSPETLQKYGAVSRETVIEMVQGVMESMKTDCAVATSGIAGPGGGTPEKPVGTIWIAVACGGLIVTEKEEGNAGRAENVKKTVHNALLLLSRLLEER
jgi:PncC family amidohydrolase